MISLMVGREYSGGYARADYEIIDQLAGSGVSVVMVSGETQENISLCDRIIALYEGRITGTLTHDQITEKSIITCMSGQKDL